MNCKQDGMIGKSSENIVLSILIITHNQRDLLKRCLNSVFSQNLNSLFEIIVSDDRSDDGTTEYVEELQTQKKSGHKTIQNLAEFVYTRCNSNESNPITTSERCGWNKLNAWRYARGKYMVNIDADDYLLHDDIYQLQINQLEAHPECSIANNMFYKLMMEQTLVQDLNGRYLLKFIKVLL